MKFKLLAAAFATTFAAGALPVLAQNYTIEPNHTFPSFEADHLGISIWRGKFQKSSGKVTLDRAAKTGTVDISIDAATIDFGHAKMEEHARGPDFFNVEKFPTITYKGTAIKFNGDQPAMVEGQLTLLGVTKPVALEIRSFKCREHPFFKKEVCGADAHAKFNRSAFGMKYGVTTPLSDEVRIQIQVEALKTD
jgi:polyisoprenoid-binding protein YceI